MNEALQIVGVVATALGGVGVIVLGLSSWLGTLWSKRLMAKFQAEQAIKLAERSDELQRETQRTLSELKTVLDIAKDTHLQFFNDRLDAYRQIIDLVSEVLDSFDKAQLNSSQDLQAAVLNLNRERIRIFAYTALIAPQPVLDAFAKLEDYLLDVSEQLIPYHWETVRAHSVALLNAMRKDLGLGVDAIAYTGRR